jgi:hypothetical protein
MDKPNSRNYKRRNRRKKKREQIIPIQKTPTSQIEHGTIKDVKIFEDMYPISIIKYLTYIFPKDLCALIDDYLLSKSARNQIELKSIEKLILGALEEFNNEAMNPYNYNRYIRDPWILYIFTIDYNIKGGRVIICQIYTGFNYNQDEKIENHGSGIYSYVTCDELSNHNDTVGIMYNMYFRSLDMCSQKKWYSIYDGQYLTDLRYEFTRCNEENEFYKWYEYIPPKD